MGQSTSVPELCKTIGVEITQKDCKIEFNSSGDVVSFGNVTRGELAVNTDVAGLGVLVAFFIPSLLLVVVGMTYALGEGIPYVLSWFNGVYQTRRIASISKWLHQHLDVFVYSVQQAQLLMLLAFGASYYSKAQCDISTYHYTVLVHQAMAAFSASILGLLLVQVQRKKVFSVFVHVALFTIALLVLLGHTFTSKTWPHQNNLPSKNQRDSMMVLPALCLLEKSLDQFDELSSEELEHLRDDGLSRNASAQSGLILILFVMVVSAKLVVWWRQRSGEPDMDLSEQWIFQCIGFCDISSWRLLINLWKFVAWALSTFLICWNWITVFVLRDWAERSGWLKLQDDNNPEADVRGLGQVAPLIVLVGTIVFTFSDSLSVWIFGQDMPPASRILSRRSDTYPLRDIHNNIAPGGYESIEPPRPGSPFRIQTGDLGGEQVPQQ